MIQYIFNIYMIPNFNIFSLYVTYHLLNLEWYSRIILSLYHLFPILLLKLGILNAIEYSGSCVKYSSVGSMDYAVWNNNVIEFYDYAKRSSWPISMAEFLWTLHSFLIARKYAIIVTLCHVSCIEYDRTLFSTLRSFV